MTDDPADTGIVVVPVDLAALCVGHRDEAAAMLAPMYDFSLLPSGSEQGGARRPNIAADVFQAGQPFSAGLRAVPGIHLHWTLPEALRHGAGQAAPGTPGGGFPAVPNRWLVTRLRVVPGGGGAASRRWVVESDRLSPVPQRTATGLPHPTVPVARAPGRPAFRHVGWHFHADDWQETAAERFAPLTAMGCGDPAFAAFYPNCCTVFGFHDDLADLPAGTSHLAYHVAGWYGGGVTDSLPDPLARPEGRAAMARFLLWPAGDPAPARMVCSGAVHRIVWDPDKRSLDDADSPLSVAIGASAAEALSVLAAVAAGAPELEGGLNALQFGLTGDAGTRLDAAERFAGHLHEAGFTSLPGGTRHVARPVSDGPPAATGAGAAPLPPLPAAVRRRLDRLNLAQEAAEARRTALDADRRRLFADWYKYLLLLYGDANLPAASEGAAPALGALLDRTTGAILARDRRLAATLARLQRRHAAVAKRLPAGWRLEQEGTARFWQPQEPTLMVLGADTRARAMAGNALPAAADGRLACRIARQAVAAVQRTDTGAVLWRTPAIKLPGVSKELRAALAALAGEAELLMPATWDRLAAPAGLAGPEDFAAAMTAFLAGTAQTRLAFGPGAAPPPGPRTMDAGWAPWLPAMLQYEVAFTPVFDERLAPGTLTSAFRWSEGDDLYFFRKFDGGRAVGIYGGTAMLAGHGPARLAAAVQALEGQHRDFARLRALANWVSRLPQAAQAMSGFAAALLMGWQAGQMAVDDPYASAPRREAIRRVAEAVGTEGWLAPLPRNSFNPLRAGGLALRRLRLIDSFGRFRTYDRPQRHVPEVLVARGLRPRSAANDARVELAFLPARITQPARLGFRWLGAGRDPSASPVLGWTLIDNVDDGLSFFSADGTPLGGLTAGVGGEPIWRPLPGAAPVGDPALALAAADPALRTFALALARGGADTLNDFRNRTRPVLEGIRPADAGGDALPLLLGRPLALVRAALWLELRGGAATSLSWADLMARLDGQPGDDGGLGTVDFPVRLGARERMNDGLVAFWTAPDGGEIDFTRFFTLSRPTGAAA